MINFFELTSANRLGFTMENAANGEKITYDGAGFAFSTNSTLSVEDLGALQEMAALFNTLTRRPESPSTEKQTCTSGSN